MITSENKQIWSKQSNTKADLLKAIKTAKSKIEPAEVKKKKLMDNTLLVIIEKGYYIKM